MKRKDVLKKVVSYVCVAALTISGVSGYISTQPKDVKAATVVDDTWSDAEIASMETIYTDFGKWQYSFTNWVEGADRSDAEAKIKTNEDGSYFGTYIIKSPNYVFYMTTKTQFKTTKGKNYRIKFTLLVNNENKDSGAYLGNIQVEGLGSRFNKRTMNGETREVSTLMTAKSNELELSFLLGAIEAGSVVEISNLSVEETDEQITTTPVVTTADPYAPTEPAPDGYTMIKPNLQSWDTFGSKGQWKIYTGSTSEESHAYVAAKEGDTPYDLSLNFVKTTANDEWIAQCKADFEVVMGETYVCEIYKNDKLASRRVFTANGTTYTTDALGLGMTPQGETVNIKAAVKEYNPIKDKNNKELLPGKYDFEGALESKYNVLLGQKYTQSTKYTPENTDEVLTDGNLNTGYLCTDRTKENQDVCVTLDKEQDVSELSCAAIDFVNNLTLASNYTVSLSQDGTNYEDIGTYTTFSGDDFTYKSVILPIDTSKLTFDKYKYVKLHLEGPNNYGYQLTEFALINKGPKVEETTTKKEPQTTKPQVTTPQVTTVKEQPVTTKAQQNVTTEQPATSAQPTTKATVVPKVKVNSAVKKAAKAKIKLKKVNKVKGYRVQLSKTKNFKKVLLTKTVSKVSFTISSKKIKKVKKLYIRAQAYVVENGVKIYGKYSAPKKVKVKK